MQAVSPRGGRARIRATTHVRGLRPYEHARMNSTARQAGFAAIVPVCALAGGWIDERQHLGFTTWRSACRAAGLSWTSLFTFTLELLPMAVIGAPVGGTVLQVVGICLRHRRGVATASLAAHGACGFAMAVTLPLCALALPIAGLLGAELLLTVLAAKLLNRLLSGNPAAPHQQSYLPGHPRVRSRAYIHP